MNIVVMSGNVTKDIELKTTQSGLSVTDFDIAVRRPRQKDVTDFFKVVCWRSNAEFAAKYFKKGSRVEVRGILTQRKFEDKEGNQRVAIEITAEELGFGESARAKDGVPQSDANFGQNVGAEDGFTEVDDDEDLPF